MWAALTVGNRLATASSYPGGACRSPSPPSVVGVPKNNSRVTRVIEATGHAATKGGPRQPISGAGVVISVAKWTE